MPTRPYWDKVAYTLDEHYIIFYASPYAPLHSQILLTRNIPYPGKDSKCEEVKLAVVPQFITPFKNGTGELLLYGTDNGWLRYYLINEFASFDMDWEQICNQTVTSAEVSV